MIARAVATLLQRARKNARRVARMKISDRHWLKVSLMGEKPAIEVWASHRFDHEFIDQIKANSGWNITGVEAVHGGVRFTGEPPAATCKRKKTTNAKADA